MEITYTGETCPYEIRELEETDLLWILGIGGVGLPR